MCFNFVVMIKLMIFKLVNKFFILSSSQSMIVQYCYGVINGLKIQQNKFRGKVNKLYIDIEAQIRHCFRIIFFITIRKIEMIIF